MKVRIFGLFGAFIPLTIYALHVHIFTIEFQTILNAQYSIYVMFTSLKCVYLSPSLLHPMKLCQCHGKIQFLFPFISIVKDSEDE